MFIAEPKPSKYLISSVSLAWSDAKIKNNAAVPQGP